MQSTYRQYVRYSTPFKISFVDPANVDQTDQISRIKIYVNDELLPLLSIRGADLARSNFVISGFLKIIIETDLTQPLHLITY